VLFWRQSDRTQAPLQKAVGLPVFKADQGLGRIERLIWAGVARLLSQRGSVDLA